jgi:large subunit ribosomal protein L15
LYQVVNLDKVEALFPKGGKITVDDLVSVGAVRDNELVKVLGTGELTVNTVFPIPPVVKRSYL